VGDLRRGDDLWWRGRHFLARHLQDGKRHRVPVGEQGTHGEFQSNDIITAPKTKPIRRATSLSIPDSLYLETFPTRV
jgi:hypothetical protein